jgi:hypothetical protein
MLRQPKAVPRTKNAVPHQPKSMLRQPNAVPLSRKTARFRKNALQIFRREALFYKEWIIFLIGTHTIFIFSALSICQTVSFKSLNLKALHEALILGT